MSHWELKPKPGQNLVGSLNEWRDKVGADLQWHTSIIQGGTQAWRATPEINGHVRTECTGKGGSIDEAKHNAAYLLNKNHVLYRKN